MLIPANLNLKALREELRLPTEQLAKRLGLSVYLVVSWIATGKANATAVELLKIKVPPMRAERLAELEAERLQARAAFAASRGRARSQAAQARGR